MARFTFSLQLAFHYNLRGDTGMIGADHPVSIVALHAVIANHRIHQCLLKGMPHVQRSSHIRWGQLNAIRGLGMVLRVLEITGLFPAGIPAGFNGFGIK